MGKPYGPRQTRLLALGVAAALFAAVLTVGCGSSSSNNDTNEGNGGGSSSSNDDTNEGNGAGGTGGTTSGKIDAQDIALAVSSLPSEFDSYYELLVEIGSGSESGSSALAPGCDTDSIDITERDAGYEIDIDQCRVEILDTLSEFNGKTTYKEKEEKENGGALDYEGYTSSLSKESDRLTTTADGTIDLKVTETSVEAGIVTLDVRFEVDVACGGEEVSGSVSYADLLIQKGNDGGKSIEGDSVISFTDSRGDTASASLTIDTEEPMRFEDEFSAYPSSGKVEVIQDGNAVIYEFVEGGVFIDDEFVSWEDIEDDDFDRVRAECSFSDFDADFGSDFDTDLVF